MSRCFFRCSYEVVQLGHFYQPDGLEFRFDDPRPKVVRLIKSHWDSQKPADSTSAVCVGETEEETVDEKMASEISLAFSTSSEGELITPKQLDPRTVEFLDGALDGLFKAMVSTISIFRWRCGLAEGPPNPGRNRHGYFSDDSKSWRKLPMTRSLRISWGIPCALPPADVIRKEVVGLVTTGTEEPLGHQLFREAWEQRRERPRSALVIGVAAAEVGFKKLVGTLVPEAQWLMDEIQTPPLVKMLDKFLPTLPVRCKLEGKSIRPPKALLKRLDKAVECRNKVVHTGQPPPSTDDLDNMLRAVSDFLWICDAYGGQGWALQNISATTLKDWPGGPSLDWLSLG